MLARMSDRICERALLVVLPLFQFSITDQEPNTIIAVTDIDNRARKTRSLRADFLPEIGKLQELLECVLQPGWSFQCTDSKGYIKIFGKILRLFDDQICDDVLLPGQARDSILKLGRHSFFRLGALHFLDSIHDKNSSPELRNLIALATIQGEEQDTLLKLRKYNTKLSLLLGLSSTSASDELETSEPAKLGIPYDVRETVKQLYEILMDSWKKPNKSNKVCEESHKAKLRLATFRTTPGSSSKVEEPAAHRDFDFLFATHDDPVVWQQSKIKVINSESTGAKVAFIKSISAAKRGPLKRAAPKPLKSLCEVIHSPGLNQSCLHIRAESDENDSKSNEGCYKMWRLPLLDCLPLSNQSPTVSLKTLFERNAYISSRQKKILAVIIAYSLLYLSETTWLEKEWGSSDICFCQTSDEGADVEKPYLSVDFLGRRGTPEAEADESPTGHLAPSILGFGIFLIELETGKSIESMLTKHDKINDQKNPNTNRTAAKRFVETDPEWQDKYQRLQLAVSACITGAFLSPETGPFETDESLQQAIYAHVVLPLEQELLHAYPVEIDKLDERPYEASMQIPAKVKSIVPSETEARPYVSALFERVPQPSEVSLSYKYFLSEKEPASWLFDSTVMLDTGSQHPPAKAHLARAFFTRLGDIEELLESGRSDSYSMVKVAVLDTGICPNHHLRARLGGYHDFVDQNFVEGKTEPKDNTGHGSDMTDLLHRTAPSAIIYMARVFDKDNGDADTAAYVAKAIEHARDEWHVDIISMSFGFKNEYKIVTKAINETPNILMFAATSNFGARETPPIRFPARISDRVISINAADGLGNPYDFPNPPPKTGINFSILGQDVSLRNVLNPDSRELSPRYGSGTSIATPIAAGIAAHVLEISKQDGLHNKVEGSEQLKTRAGMSSVLRRMAKDGRIGGFDFIAPDKVLLVDEGINDSERMGRICKRISNALRKRYN